MTTLSMTPRYQWYHLAWFCAVNDTPDFCTRKYLREISTLSENTSTYVWIRGPDVLDIWKRGSEISWHCPCKSFYLTTKCFFYHSLEDMLTLKDKIFELPRFNFKEEIHKNLWTSFSMGAEKNYLKTTITSFWQGWGEVGWWVGDKYSQTRLKAKRCKSDFFETTYWSLGPWSGVQIVLTRATMFPMKILVIRAWHIDILYYYNCLTFLIAVAKVTTTCIFMPTVVSILHVKRIVITRNAKLWHEICELKNHIFRLHEKSLDKKH